MSYAWNHTWAAGDYLLDHVTLSTWHHAFIQRFGSGLGVPDYSPVAAGDDASLVAFWRDMQFTLGEAEYPFLTFGIFVVYANYNGVAASLGAGSLSIPIVDGPYIKTTALGGNGYPRNYPKEFGNMVSITYQDGGAFVNGDNAKNLSDGLVYARTAGNWVRAAVGMFADVVTKYGRAAAGDYLGLSKPINDATNILIAVNRTGTWSADGATNQHATDPSTATVFSTLAASRTDQTTKYAIPELSGSLDDPPISYSLGVYLGPLAPVQGYNGFLERVKAKALIDDDATGLTPSIEVYCDAAAPDLSGGITTYVGNGFSDTSPAGPVFDDNGDGVLNLALFKFATVTGLGTGGTLKTAYLGSFTQPVFCPTPVDPASYGSGADRETRMKGYMIGAAPIPVYNYGVAGGFDERP